MSVVPNFDGFADAQARLRESFGHDIDFDGEVTVIWPPDAILDPERGRPYDPTISPLSSAATSATVRCSVVDRPLGLSQSGTQANVANTALGFMEDGDIVLIAGETAFGIVGDMVRFTYKSQRFKIERVTCDYLGPVRRTLIYGSKQ